MKGRIHFRVRAILMRAIVGACLFAAAASAARAQSLPEGPLVFGDGVVTIGGDASLSIGSADPFFFNYSDYQYSALRRLHFGIAAQVKVGNKLALLSEVRLEHTVLPEDRSQGSSRAETSALYLRIHPWTARRFDIQIGRIPPTFGSFARRSYSTDNPLIGYPMLNQYLLSLRPDSVPAHADELLQMRGRGWLSRFSVGNPEPDHGVPLESAFKWDTGLQVHAHNDVVSVTGSITAGSLANPLVSDDNGGRNYAGRVTYRPTVGLVIGGSAAHAPFLTTDATIAATGSDIDRFTQQAYGADVEYSWDRYILRAETLFSRWKYPVIAQPFIDRPLDSLGFSTEGRYRIRPGLYAAARFDHITFSDITGSTGTRAWEAPVTRLEAGGGYSLQRNLLLKGSYQYNKRESTRTTVDHLVAAEVLFWF